MIISTVAINSCETKFGEMNRLQKNGSLPQYNISTRMALRAIVRRSTQTIKLIIGWKNKSP
jgi:hypothetical protein